MILEYSIIKYLKELDDEKLFSRNEWFIIKQRSVNRLNKVIKNCEANMEVHKDGFQFKKTKY